VNSFGTVDSVLIMPTDAENVEDYRKSVIESFRIEPQGGALGDIRIWAKDAAYVREVYPSLSAAGLLFVAIESTIGDGLSWSALELEVRSVLENDPDTTLSDNERTRIPVGVYGIETGSVVLKNVDVTISGLSDSSYLPLITSSIRDFLKKVRPFIAGLDSVRNSTKGYLYASDIYGIVKNIIQSNATFISLVVSVDGAPISIYEFQGRYIPFLNSVN